MNPPYDGLRTKYYALLRQVRPRTLGELWIEYWKLKSFLKEKQ